MPWPTYSERFVSVFGHAGMTWYTVPTNRRAVLTDMAFVNAYGIAGTVQVYIDDFQLYTFVFPAQVAARHEAYRVPVYEGERLGAYTSDAKLAAVLSGYLFEDLSARAAAPLTIQTAGQGLPPAVEELPTT